MTRTTSDLPFGSEFSPAQIDLSVLLELAHEHRADWKAFEAAVRDRYFAGPKSSDYNKGKLANNTKLSQPPPSWRPTSSPRSLSSYP